MRGWDPFPRWYGWDSYGEDAKPLVRVIVWCPLSAIEYNRYGCRVVPERWQRYA
jgi:hypothetical protein